MERYYYFDYAATTFYKPEQVYQKMDQVNRYLAVNAGRGSYALGAKALALIDDTRNELLQLTNAAHVAEVVLTPSATIAFNQIIGGLPLTPQDVIYVSPFEHNAVARCLQLRQDRMKEQNGQSFTCLQMPVKQRKEKNCIETEIDLEKLQFDFGMNPPTYVFTNAISNVTGYQLPLTEILTLAKKLDAVTVVDGAQALGLLPMDLTVMPIDFLVFAGHKNLYGPFGVGGFYMRKGHSLAPYLAGGTGSDSLNLRMPEGYPTMYEPASPNVVAIAGLGEALTFLKQDQKTYLEAVAQWETEEKQKTVKLYDELIKLPGVTLYGAPLEKQTAMVSFTMDGYLAQELGMILDQDFQIAVRTGYHCAPYIHQYLKDESFGGVVRASIGRQTTEEEISYLIEALRKIGEE